MELECTAHPNPTTVVGVGTEYSYSGADWGGTQSNQRLLKFFHTFRFTVLETALGR